MKRRTPNHERARPRPASVPRTAPLRTTRSPITSAATVNAIVAKANAVVRSTDEELALLSGAPK